MNTDNPKGQHNSSPEIKRLTTRDNRRRLIVLTAVILLVIFSFIAIRYHNSQKPYIKDDPMKGQVGSDKAGIPPDSLHH
jgi:hypothetical protein